MEDFRSGVPINNTFLLGNPHMVSPPPPSDTPPPASFLIHFNHSIKPSIGLKELQNTVRETTSKSLQTYSSPWKFLQRIFSMATQKLTPPSETKIINPIQFNLFREICIRQYPDEVTIGNSLSVLIRIRSCSTATFHNIWIGNFSPCTSGFKLFYAFGKIVNAERIIFHRCIILVSTQLHTVSRHGSMLKGIGDIMGIREKESKGKTVKTAGAISEGTKDVFCQVDKVGCTIHNILCKVYLEMGEAYPLCFLNKWFNMFSISTAAAKFNSCSCFEPVLVTMSFSCVVFVSVLVTTPGNMSRIMCTNYYEMLALGAVMKISQKIFQPAGLRSIRLRKRLNISLLPQHLVYMPSPASVPSDPSLHDDYLRRVLSVPTRDDDCEEIVIGYLRRILRFPIRDDKISELLPKNYGLLLWVVFQEELIALAFVFYHSRSRVYRRTSNKQLTWESRRSRVRHTTWQFHTTSKLEKSIIKSSNMFLCKLCTLSVEKPKKASELKADIALPQSLPLSHLGDKLCYDIPDM